MSIFSGGLLPPEPPAFNPNSYNFYEQQINKNLHRISTLNGARFLKVFVCCKGLKALAATKTFAKLAHCTENCFNAAPTLTLRLLETPGQYYSFSWLRNAQNALLCKSLVKATKHNEALKTCLQNNSKCCF